MKHTRITRLLSILLTLCLVASTVVLPAAAADAAESADSYDGSQLWLNYRLVKDTARLSEYRAAATAIVVENYDANPTFRHSRNGVEWTPQRPSNAKETVPASTLEAARLELSRAMSGLLGQDVPYAASVAKDGAIVVGTPESSPLIAALNLDADLAAVGDEGYLIRSATVGGKAATVIAGNTEIGALYGTYAFIRLMQTQKSVSGLNITDQPKVNHRRLNNWDTERLYAGTNATGEGSSTGGDGSIFEFGSGNTALPMILDRYIIFARMCASVGINEITINNVNAKEAYLSEAYILNEAALADVLRPYGVKIGLSVRYTSATNSACNTSADTAAGGPSQISGNDANNPYVEKFQNWWTKKTEQIRSRIPDFIGYTVKANSEGQPGPQDYGYDHGDGAYGLGQALAKVNDGLPNNMTLFWRTFVYNASVDTDRLKRAYMEFKPINDDPSRSFGDNVFVQTKNGPLDFQGREPIHPMFGAMDQTNQAIEVQITQEYTGHHVSLCYLGTEWEEIYKTDTRTGGKQVLVGEVLDGSAQGQADTAIVGVNNLGNSANLTGNHFAQANFFAFGRQAWDWTQSAEDIAEDWARMTWSNDDEVVETIVTMMMGSYEALVSYQTPYGVGHQMTGTGTHYFPNPAQIIFNGGSIRDDWSPAYYSRVDGVGVGYNRSGHTEQTSFGMQMGSDLAHQYADELAAQYDNIETTPENLLLWFHHVPWDYEMSDGRTFWEDAVYKMQEGVQFVSWMRDAWASLEGKIDSTRFKAVTEKLFRQEIDSSEWRDFYRGYWNANNGLDIPVDDGALSIAVTLGSGANQKTYQGFDLSVDSFNKTQPGNLPNSDSRYSRYNAAGGSIADASGSPFSNMFVAVDKAYTLCVPSNVSRTVSKVEFLSDGSDGQYEVVSQTDSQIVIKVTREGSFGPLSKTYTFNLTADTALSEIKVNDTLIPGFDPDDTAYAVVIDDVAPVVPAITAKAEDPNAQVTVKNASGVPGVTTIEVKNGSAAKTYSVSLTGKAAFDEEFDGSAPSGEWSWVRENASNWKQDGSALTITTESGDIKGGTNTAKNILTRSTGGGDWEATAKLKLSAVPSGSNQAAFLVYQDDGNYLKVNLEYSSNYLRASGGAERNGSYTELFYDALETRQNLSASQNVVYFRITKEANKYRLSWGTDDTDLRSLGVTTISLSDPKVGTLATGNFRVSYDSIRLEDRCDLLVESTCEHEYKSTVTAPTCTEAGFTTYTCTKCGASYTGDRVDPLGHDWDSGKVTTEPTETTSGVLTYTCTRCGTQKTERIPRTGAGPVDIDFTNTADADKYEIVGQSQAAPAQGTGLALVTTRNAVETCNDQNSGDQANTPEDLVRIPVNGDWTATLTVDFNTNGASNGYYQFFGFYGAEGEDYQNMAGIRGGNNDLQNFLRVGGAITADTDGVKSSPGFSSNGTYVLRLEKEGTTYICYRTNDGENFTEMFRYEDTGIEAEYIVIDAYTGMTTGYKFTLKSLTFEGGGGTEPPAVNYDELNNAIAAAEGIDLTDYTDASVAALNSALSAARIAAYSTKQAEVDAAAAALNDAIAALEKKPAPEPDKTALEQAIRDAEALDPNDYTDESAAALARAITAAKAALRAAQDQEAIDSALSALNSVIESLEAKAPAADKTELDVLVSAAEKYVEDDFTPESFAQLTAAVEAAKAVQSNEEATQDEVDAAAQAVQDALDHLEKLPEALNKEALINAIAAAEALNPDDYTADSAKALADALAAANDALANAADQNAVDAAADALQNVIDHLETKPEEPPIGELDKSKLEQAIKAAEKLDPSKYTDESAKALKDAIAAAKAALKAAMNQEAIDTSLAKLNDAITKLEEKSGGNPEEPPAGELDKSKLEQAIKAAEDLNPSDYTDASAEALDKAIKTAKAALNAAMDQDAIKAALDALNAAVGKLEKKPGGSDHPGNPDKPTDPDKPSNPDKPTNPDKPSDFRFDDVKNPKAFYFEPVYWAYNAKPQITNGVTKTTFGPEQGCTRGQVVTFLWRAAKCPEPKSTRTDFTDLKAGAFYETAVAWAVEEGITNGMTATTFAPDATCTRGQIVTFLWRFKQSPAPKSETTKFTDVSAKAFYAKAVAWAVENEVTKGMTETTFCPNDTCTRGQIVTFLYRAMGGK